MSCPRVARGASRQSMSSATPVRSASITAPSRCGRSKWPAPVSCSRQAEWVETGRLMSRSGRACSGLAALVLPDHLAVAAGAREHAGEHEQQVGQAVEVRSEEHTSELQSLMRISYAVFCLKKKTRHTNEAKK